MNANEFKTLIKHVNFKKSFVICFGNKITGNREFIKFNVKNNELYYDNQSICVWFDHWDITTMETLVLWTKTEPIAFIDLSDLVLL